MTTSTAAALSAQEPDIHWPLASAPPAGATTLIVSLGLMPYLWQIPTLMLAVLLLTVQALVINRLAGLNYPLWASERPDADEA